MSEKLYLNNVQYTQHSPLDSEIRAILDDTTKPVDIKVKLYFQTLAKYKEPTPMPAGINWEKEVLESVPHDKRYKAKNILRHIQLNRDTHILPSGELVYQQQTLSNVVDLVSDILSKRKLVRPQGWMEFAKSLPPERHIIVNDDSWNSLKPSSERKTSVKREINFDFT